MKLFLKEDPTIEYDKKNGVWEEKEEFDKEVNWHKVDKQHDKKDDIDIVNF